MEFWIHPDLKSAKYLLTTVDTVFIRRSPECFEGRYSSDRLNFDYQNY
ncbi:hypothetical protein [Calothrix sp. NIES-2100]